jgi:hypothetical protein
VDFRFEMPSESSESGSASPKRTALDDGVFWMELMEEVALESELGAAAKLLRYQMLESMKNCLREEE